MKVMVREMVTGLWRFGTAGVGLDASQHVVIETECSVLIPVSMPKLVGVGVIADDLGGEHEGQYKQPMTRRSLSGRKMSLELLQEDKGSKSHWRHGAWSCAGCTL